MKKFLKILIVAMVYLFALNLFGFISVRMIDSALFGWGIYIMFFIWTTMIYFKVLDKIWDSK